MARAMRFRRAGVAARQVATAGITTFVQAAIGPIDWQEWWTFEDYRIYTNLQVFAAGMAAYAGKPPTIQAATAGMDSVFTFVMANATWPPPNGAGPDPKAEAAAEAAVEVARTLYEEDVIDAVLPALIAKWAKRLGVQAIGGAAPGGGLAIGAGPAASLKCPDGYSLNCDENECWCWKPWNGGILITDTLPPAVPGLTPQQAQAAAARRALAGQRGQAAAAPTIECAPDEQVAIDAFGKLYCRGRQEKTL